MRGIGETPEERYATLERIARALERIAEADEARIRMADEARERYERVEETLKRLEQEVDYPWRRGRRPNEVPRVRVRDGRRGRGILLVPRVRGAGLPAGGGAMEAVHIALGAMAGSFLGSVLADVVADLVADRIERGRR